MKCLGSFEGLDALPPCLPQPADVRSFPLSPPSPSANRPRPRPPSAGQQLVNPCRCATPVHQDCLMQWLRMRMVNGGVRAPICEVCRGPLTGVLTGERSTAAAPEHARSESSIPPLTEPPRHLLLLPQSAPTC